MTVHSPGLLELHDLARRSLAPSLLPPLSSRWLDEPLPRVQKPRPSSHRTSQGRGACPPPVPRGRTQVGVQQGEDRLGVPGWAGRGATTQRMRLPLPEARWQPGWLCARLTLDLAAELLRARPWGGGEAVLSKALTDYSIKWGLCLALWTPRLSPTCLPCPRDHHSCRSQFVTFWFSSGLELLGPPAALWAGLRRPGFLLALPDTAAPASAVSSLDPRGPAECQGQWELAHMQGRAHFCPQWAHRCTGGENGQDHPDLAGALTWGQVLMSCSQAWKMRGSSGGTLPPFPSARCPSAVLGTQKDSGQAVLRHLLFCRALDLRHCKA